MSQPPQSPDAPGTTDVDSGVDSLTDEATSDVERAAAQAADDRSEHSGPPDDQDADDTDYDDDYRAPVVVAPLPGASSGPVQGGRRVSTPHAAEAPRPHRSAPTPTTHPITPHYYIIGSWCSWYCNSLRCY